MGVKYPRELRDEVRAARRKGWAMRPGGSGHLKWYDEEGRLQAVTSMTPSDRRGILNSKATLRKAGIVA